MLKTYLLVNGYVYVLVSVCMGVVLYLWLAFKLIMDSRKPPSHKKNRERQNFEEACQTTLSTVPYFFSLLLTGQYESKNAIVIYTLHILFSIEILKLNDILFSKQTSKRMNCYQFYAYFFQVE